mmetsp:Transcript_1368/g.2926  ORF Transcript_1368/g.2926 Transcript_1368/m.2926 type:complete len:254 (+) Transcript_1368:424-1185(+)
MRKLDRSSCGSLAAFRRWTPDRGADTKTVPLVQTFLPRCWPGRQTCREQSFGQPILDALSCSPGCTPGRGRSRTWTRDRLARAPGRRPAPRGSLSQNRSEDWDRLLSKSPRPPSRASECWDHSSLSSGIAASRYSVTVQRQFPYWQRRHRPARWHSPWNSSPGRVCPRHSRHPSSCLLRRSTLLRMVAASSPVVQWQARHPGWVSGCWAPPVGWQLSPPLPHRRPSSCSSPQTALQHHGHERKKSMAPQVRGV